MSVSDYLLAVGLPQYIGVPEQQGGSFTFLVLSAYFYKKLLMNLLDIFLPLIVKIKYS